MSRIPRSSLTEYLRYVLSRRNLSTLLYMMVGVFAIFLITISTLFLFRNLKMIFFIILFLFLGAATNTLNRFLPISLGVELIMMGTIISSRVYSPTIGIMIGIISLTISELLMMKFKIGLVFSYIGIIVVAFLSSVFSNTDITTTGIILTIIYDLIILPGYYLTGSNPIKILAFAFTHIAFNAWVFLKLAPFFVELMV